jgi:hypothetical protein
MKYMAHIVQGKVVNVSLWGGKSEWSPNEEVIEIPTEKYVNNLGDNCERPLAGIDWDYIDGKFVDNRPQDEDDE